MPFFIQMLIGLLAAGLIVLDVLMFITCWRQIMATEKPRLSRVLWIIVTLLFIPTPIGVLIYMVYVADFKDGRNKKPKSLS